MTTDTPTFLVEHKDGVVLSVLLTPRAGSERLVGLHDGQLKVAVSAPPVEGAANEALVKFLAKKLKLPKSSIELISGETSRKKRLLLHGLSLAAAAKLFAEHGI